MKSVSQLSTLEKIVFIIILLIVIPVVGILIKHFLFYEPIDHSSYPLFIVLTIAVILVHLFFDYYVKRKEK